jgi:hypothetical protein
MPDASTLTTSIGTTGLLQYSGRLDEEYLRELYGPRWLRVVKQMVNDPTICAALLAIEMLLRQVTWDVVPADETPEAIAAADYIESCWLDMAAWPDTLAEILTMLPYGWCGLELIYKVRNGLRFRADGSEDVEQSSRFTDGKIGWACWSPRAQDTLDRWEFGEGGALLGLWQIAPPTYVSTFIPVEKLLHLRTTSRKGSPEGRSIIRGAYRPWYFGNNIENIEGVGIERDLAGFPVVKVPASVIKAGGADYTAWKNLATGIKRDEQEGAVIPSDVYPSTNTPLYDITLLSSGGRRSFDTDAIVARYDSRKAMAMLADVILMGHDKVGSFALSSNKTELLGVALGAFLETISLGTAAQAFRRLLRLNGMDEALTPALAHGDIETTDLAGLGAYLLNLTKSGMKIFPNPDLEQYLLEQAGLPIPEGGVVEPDEANKPVEEAAPVGAPV